MTKFMWEPMTFTVEGDISDIVRMPGNGKTHVGQDPGDFKQPPGLHKKPGCENDPNHPGTPPGFDPNCPEIK